MFRSVRKLGFDQAPDWLTRVEAAIPVMADEVEKSADGIGLQFHLAPGAPGGGAVEVELTDHRYGRGVVYWGKDVLADEAKIRRRVRRLHMDILNAYLERLVDKWKAESVEPVGA